MPGTEPPADIASLLGVERGRLSELLGSLERADWDRPSPCPGWTVLGLCCHLVGDDLSLLSRHRDGHHGTRPPDGAGEDDFIAWLDGLQAQWVSAARRLSPRLVTELLGWTGPQLVETFRHQDPPARTTVVSWAGPGLVPVWLDQLRELSEYWIHRQQLLQALDRPSDLRADLTGPILSGLRWAYPFRLGQIQARPGDTVTIEVTGPVTLTWQLVAADPAGWEYRNLAGPQVVASLSMTTEQAWRLLTNNLPPAEQAHLAMAGDPTIIDVLRQTRAIIGTPR